MQVIILVTYLSSNNECVALPSDNIHFEVRFAIATFYSVVRKCDVF